MVVYLFAAKGLKEQQLSYTKTTLNKQPTALKQLRQYGPGKIWSKDLESATPEIKKK